jgi:hypothetical protein
MLEENAEETDAGTIWNISVQGFLPGSPSAGLRTQLDEMMRQRFVLEVTDLNGDRRQVGTPEHPMSFSYRNRSGQQVGDRRGLSLIWSGPMTYPPPVL